VKIEEIYVPAEHCKKIDFQKVEAVAEKNMEKAGE
jgi:hypothetical protein